MKMIACLGCADFRLIDHPPMARCSVVQKSWMFKVCFFLRKAQVLLALPV
jgi:hypothetical protein